MQAFTATILWPLHQVLEKMLTIIICIGYLPKNGATETRGVGV